MPPSIRTPATTCRRIWSVPDPSAPLRASASTSRACVTSTMPRPKWPSASRVSLATVLPRTRRIPGPAQQLRWHARSAGRQRRWHHLRRHRRVCRLGSAACGMRCWAKVATGGSSRAPTGTTAVRSARMTRARRRISLPGEYQRTYALVRKGSDKIRPQTVVNALRSGNAFAASGQIIDRLAFVACASYPGLLNKTNAAVEALPRLQRPATRTSTTPAAPPWARSSR